MVLILGLRILQAAVQEPNLGEMGLGRPERWQEGVDGQSRLEERWGHRQLSPAQ